MDIETKKCGRCKEVLTVDVFSKNKLKKDGLDNYCKTCKKKALQKYRVENKELIVSKRRKNYEKNSEKIKEQVRGYREGNRDKVLVSRKKHYEANKTEILRRNKDYYYKNTDQKQELSRKYYESHKVKLLEKSKKYSEENRDTCNVIHQRRRSRELSLPATLTAEQWNIIKTHFNNKCCYCGKEYPLAQEHFFPLSKGGELGKANIVPACRSCNSSKRDKTFFEWYPKYKHYSKDREVIILKFLNYKNGIQQLALL